MTVGQAIDQLPVSAIIKSGIRTMLRAAKPGWIDRQVVVRIDREAGTLAFGVEGEPLATMTFDEVESHVADPVAR